MEIKTKEGYPMRMLMARSLTVLGLALGALLVLTPPSKAQEPCAANCGHCQKFHCPHTKHCLEGAPRICFQCGCPKPICCPCDQPNFGYYQTCWTPWPYPPDWSHCPVQPPASAVNINPFPRGATGPPEEIPTAPRKSPY